MFHSTESDSPSLPNVRHLEQALGSLMQSVTSHFDRESRLERFSLGWQQKWFTQFEQLRSRIDALEAQLAPWMTDRNEGPRLAVVPQSEDAA